MERVIPLYTLEGVQNAETSTHYINTDDGLGLSLLRFTQRPCKDVVVLLHGLTNSSDMFIMPEHHNLVSYLHDNGFTDVWCFDFRMSCRYSYNLFPNKYSLDDCALYDHPKAIEHIRKTVGEETRIHVIGQCHGSMSFSMSLAAKQVTEISSFILNSISLNPHIRPWSWFKITFFPFILERILNIRYVSPGWGYEPRLTLGKLLSKVISLFHHECNEPACHTLSLMWGTGWPALYRYENIDPITHARLQDLFSATGLNYHNHIRKMVNAGNQAVIMYPSDARYNALPDNYFEQAAEIDTPILFVTGDQNKIFCDSNIRAYEQLNKQGCSQHQLHIYENYGHSDIFIGKNSSIDIFPRMLEFLRQHAHP